MDIYKKLLENQRNYFHTNVTKMESWRIEQLLKLETMIRENESEILVALKMDLGKSEFEAYATEVGFLLDSIKKTVKHLKEWMKPQKVSLPLHQFGASGKVMHEPYGCILIIGPFNYPFQLLMEPLVAALAAGNTAVLKPSEYTEHTSDLLERLIGKTFDESVIAVVRGDRKVTNDLIHMKFDHIFFTGSVPVGKIVMEAASKNLTPVTLELGGKSPTIVEDSANIEIAAKRIVWGKFMNAGQTCIAPDYIYVSKRKANDLIEAIKKSIQDFYGTNVKNSSDYGRIVSDKHFNRLTDLIDYNKVVFGGETAFDEKYIEPTILYPVTWEDKVMEDEIFGPVLPIMIYDNLNEVIAEVRSRPKPLALYLFTEDDTVEERIMNTLSFGGGCINDTLSHVVPHDLPFGGVGQSGHGNYHGKAGFLTLSHTKSILKKSTKLDIKVAFPPYKGKLKLIKKLLG